MRHRVNTVGMLLAAWAVYGGSIMENAGAQMPPTALTIADFETADTLDKVVSNVGVSVSLADRDPETGLRHLEVRVRPFSEHGNKWPYIFLHDRYFTTPVDLTPYSRVVTSVRNVTEGLATVRITMSSKPYNDGGRNLEGEGFVIPGGTTMECSLNTALFRRSMNDPSSIQMLMFVFPAKETEAVYRIGPIRAVHDAATGSPAGTLAADTGALMRQIEALDGNVNWQAIAPEKQRRLRERIPELQAQVRVVQQQAETARAQGWQGAYNTHRATINTIGRQLGEFALADKTGFHLWYRSPYTYVYRDALPTFDSPTIGRITLQMARNEFRDTQMMITPCDGDVELVVEVDAAQPGLADVVLIRWSEFVTLPEGEEYGDVLFPVDGPLHIPHGESRELWLTFDGRWHGIDPGEYELSLSLHDLVTGTSKTIPVTLTVWDIDLPSYDVLPNNAYVEYHNSEIGAQVPDQGVKHMKMYGVNMVYVYPHELPWPVRTDQYLRITDFPSERLIQRIEPILEAWRSLPGDERLMWVFALTGGPERLLEGDAVAYPSEQWKAVFTQWLSRFRELMGSLGIADDEWMFVLADESSESVLITYEIPFAEMIKSIDRTITLSCNASQVVNDPAMAERFFAAFDILQPNLDALHHSRPLRDWLTARQPTLWTYRCESMAGADRNLYDYYRVYAWDILDYGITGTGIWTYCAQGESPWGEGKRGIAYNLVFKHRDKDEVVHSRRYEFYREGVDDYRYVRALSAASGDDARMAEFIRQAIVDITANRGDVTRCEKWRLRIAEEILRQTATTQEARP